jgi:hypothetical protein
VGSRRRLARVPRELLRRPYAAFALVYTFAFIYAFSSINNFGILVRERSQLLPVLFVVLCLPLPGGNQDPDDGFEPVLADEIRRY